MLYRQFLLALGLACLTLVAQTPQPEAQRIERLVGLGKLWGKVRFQHPDLPTRPIDWDRAFVDGAALVKINSSKEDYALAVETMLKRLGDPATSVTKPSQPSLVELPSDFRLFSWLDDRTLLVHLNNVTPLITASTGLETLLSSLREATKEAKGIILDLRPEKGFSAISEIAKIERKYYAGFCIEALTPLLIDRPLVLPAKRVRIHQGYRGDIEAEDVYFTGTLLKGGKVINPDTEGRRLPVVVLINQETYLPAEIRSLQKAGQAQLLTEGPVNQNWGAETSPVTLPDGVQVTCKVADWVFENGTIGCLADGQVTSSSRIDASSPGIQAALRMLGTQAGRAVTKQAENASIIPIFRPDPTYAEMSYPAKEYRLLAAVKFWTAIDQTFPYKGLLDHPWDDQTLAEFFRLLESTSNAEAYQLGVARMLARIQESHGSLEVATGTNADEGQMPEPLKKYFGTGSLPIALQVLEGEPVVVWLGDNEIKRGAFRLGDVLLKVDGEDARARMERIRPYISASTKHRLDFRTANRLLKGKLGEEGVVVVRGVDGATRTISVQWGSVAPTITGGIRKGPVFTKLPGEIGYVDLDRLVEGEVKPMVEALLGTQAIIFDMRGYPTTGAMAALQHFLRLPEAKTAVMSIPLLMGEPEEGNRISATCDVAYFPAIAKTKFNGRIIMLMDERAQSFSETVGLILEANAMATFIGSPTSGANGNVTTVVLPGALRLYYTGMAFKHADGGQLQRKGLQPHIFVRPTSRGLADGRDEVLERALRFVKEGH